MLKNQKFRALLPIGDGSFVMKELPGPQNLQPWLVSWRVFKLACISLNIVTLAALQLYEKVIEKLVIQWPRAWGLIAQADDKARAEKLEKIRRSIVLEMAAGSPAPRELNEAEPWTACFRALALDETFWNEQVRHPAAEWLASGAHGSPNPPAEAMPMVHRPGLPVMEIAEREELAQFREQRVKGDFGKGKGKGKGKDQAGQEQLGSVRECTLCFSPAHPNAECRRKAAPLVIP